MKHNDMGSTLAYIHKFFTEEEVKEEKLIEE